MTYTAEVRRLGGYKPYRNEDGSPYKLSNAASFTPSDVETDGKGNILAVPLYRRKDCFGRPERAVRGGLERGRPFGPINEYGEPKRGKTRCDRCPLFDACMDVADERLRSAPEAMAALDAWWVKCKKTTGFVGTNASYVGIRGILWRAFLSAIEDHGGWTTVNDDQIRLDDLNKRDEINRKRRERRAADRLQTDLDRHFGRDRLSDAFFQALNDECERRARHLNRLRQAQGAPPWIRKLPEKSCRRLANVWWAIELMKRTGEQPSGREIASLLAKEGRAGGSRITTLHARICEDLRSRLPKLEIDLGNGPIWGMWSFETP